MSDLTPIQSDNLCAKHGFFTRVGGVSVNADTGRPSDLNCGFLSGDDPEDLLKNRELVRNHLKASCLASLNQVHSNKVVAITDEPRDWDFERQADGLVTNVTGVAIGAMSADCGPVLFHDPVNRVVGAAHAGWNGAIGGILENTVAAMVDLGAETTKIHATLGPCIQQPSYQVGPEFYRQFCEKSMAYGAFFIASDKSDHWQFDLAAFVVDRLQNMNLASAISTGQDTCGDAQNFFSHRRGTLSGTPDRMRHISAICL